jgi:cardiolipin synthase
MVPDPFASQPDVPEVAGRKAAQLILARAVTMTNEKAYDSEFDAIVAAGGHVHLYADSTKALYVHAKVISADAASSDRKIYVGSINFSDASMDNNRELGIITTSSSVVKSVTAVVDGDFDNCSAASDCTNYTG